MAVRTLTVRTTFAHTFLLVELACPNLDAYGWRGQAQEFILALY
jgi:hypothetical protein